MGQKIKDWSSVGFAGIGILALVYIAFFMGGNIFEKGTQNIKGINLELSPAEEQELGLPEDFMKIATLNLQTQEQIETSYKKLALQNYLIIFLLVWIVIGISILIYQNTKKN